MHRWKPIQGRAPLIVAWRAVLRANGLAADDALFPIRRPLDDSAGLWSAFSRSVLGFVPSATAEDQPLWEDLQKRAYGGVQRPLPTALPEDGAALADWYRFETMLAVRGAAHRFVVALPVPPTDTGNASDYQQRRALAERLVALEKPAHTVFEVRFYWAMFCIGEARLGIDTRIHRGSRIPELLGPAVLGQSYLAEGYLTPRPPQDAADRSILGRDLLRE